MNCKGGREISAGNEAGVRLSCHLLFRSFIKGEKRTQLFIYS